MENLIVSVNVVFPLFALMAVGFLLNRIGLLDGRTAEKMNTVTFKAFLPVLIFYNIYRTDVGGSSTRASRRWHSRSSRCCSWCCG